MGDLRNGTSVTAQMLMNGTLLRALNRLLNTHHLRTARKTNWSPSYPTHTSFTGSERPMQCFHSKYTALLRCCNRRFQFPDGHIGRRPPAHTLAPCWEPQRHSTVTSSKSARRSASRSQHWISTNLHAASINVSPLSQDLSSWHQLCVSASWISSGPRSWRTRDPATSPDTP